MSQEDDSTKITHSIKKRLRERGLTQEDFANLMGISRSTIARLLKGESVKPEVRRSVLAHLGIADPGNKSQASAWKGAPDFFGGYTPEETSYLTGTYIGARREFEVTTRIRRSVYTFRWIDHPRCICAFEYDSASHKDDGHLSATFKNFVTISPVQKSIDLFVNSNGANRLMKFSEPRNKEDKELTLYGAILTATCPDGGAFRPADGEVVLVKQERPLNDEEIETLFNKILPGTPGYDYWSDMLALSRARLYSTSKHF